MTKHKKINTFRRGLMRKLTHNVGHSTKIERPSGKPDFKRILICRPNGRLGNLLLITPLIQEITETFPDCKMDLFIKGNLGPILFKNYKTVDRIIKLPGKPFNHLLKYAGGWIALKKHSYDMVINVVPTSSSGRLSTQAAHSKYKLFGELPESIQNKYKDHEHIAKHPVYAFRHYLNTLGMTANNQPVSSLDLRLSTEELEEGSQILKDLIKNENQTISLFTYATGEKCHSEAWWMELYEKLKVTYPDYNIIEILPKENISKIGFKAPSYYSRNIRQIGAFMANTAIFIGADSGMMHLSSASLTPTVGLFSVTKTNVYEPYNNGSIAINTNHNSTDACLNIVHSILR